MSSRNSVKKASIMKRKKNQQVRYKACIIGAVVSILLFFCMFSKIMWTSNIMQHQLDHMELGVDYFYEDIPVIRKDYNSYFGTDDSSVETTNYVLYYTDSDYIYVDKDTYDGCVVGDTVKAYTKDHKTYYFNFETLPGITYTNNEISKAMCAVIACVAFFFMILAWVNKEC